MEELQAPPPRIVATIGNFDGVHLGHQRIIDALRARAAELSALATVITFEPHPLKVLRPDDAPALITTYARRDRLIAHFGVSLLIVIPFDFGFASLEAEEFVERYLWEWLHVRHMFMGFNSHFGRARKGNFVCLEQAGRTFGFDVTQIGPVVVGGQPVSSSRIRNVLGEGDVAFARELLGHAFGLQGRVVKGDGRGKLLGLPLPPTANIETQSEITPPNGVYCGHLVVAGNVHQAVVNIGTKPTFGAARRTIEAHVLDFESDLYGSSVELFFEKRLRDEIRFDAPQALIAQIRRDIEQARQILALSSDVIP